ncbi:hypothetical protein ALISP_5293 [Alicycliphilus sp. B1]|nr:hypothetical protein ALISP_5293 [Alicycliphilus sp. B1]
MLAGEKDALEVVVHLGVPDLLAHLHGAALGRAAHVVDEDVQPPQRVDAPGDGVGHRGALGHVAGARDEGAAASADEFGGLLQAGGIAVHAEHPGARLGKAHGDGAAIAPAGADGAGAGDKGGLPGQAAVGIAGGGGVEGHVG